MIGDLFQRLFRDSSQSLVVALLQGAIPFAADLMRAIEKRGKHPIYDSLWLESYRDERESSGKVVVRADISRSVEGRPALIVDDVFDSGRTIAFARDHIPAIQNFRSVILPEHSRCVALRGVIRMLMWIE